jgi:hypothetical protein
MAHAVFDLGLYLPAGGRNSVCGGIVDPSHPLYLGRRSSSTYASTEERGTVAGVSHEEVRLVVCLFPPPGLMDVHTT